MNKEIEEIISDEYTKWYSSPQDGDWYGAEALCKRVTMRLAERWAGKCLQEAKIRDERSNNPPPGDDPMAQAHKAITARTCAALIHEDLQ